MKKDKDIEIIKAIDNYVNGRLGPEETDQLWARLLERPEYYELLRTEAALKKRYDNRMQESVQEYGSGETIDQDDAGPKNSTRKTGAVRLGHAPWLLAAAVEPNRNKFNPELQQMNSMIDSQVDPYKSLYIHCENGTELSLRYDCEY